jgi:hypothetical protein
MTKVLMFVIAVGCSGGLAASATLADTLQAANTTAVNGTDTDIEIKILSVAGACCVVRCALTLLRFILLGAGQMRPVCIPMPDTRVCVATVHAYQRYPTIGL